ncbi:hypothetical protein ONA70_32940 [Micromonospora yasonensis]|uniref:hypothetical protein n=1 Tax=Micromonospora yasonensis TaxID=1128667 RepID=UPI002232822E|nr:hypothetical protein [Micromonospora yasonensis]MCW3844892.1 hypothetical protein [Micromonospora yasonensis]
MPRTIRQLASFTSACLLLGLGAVTPSSASASSGEDPACPWVGSSASPDERAKTVLSQITVDEKVSTLGLNASPDGYQNYFPAILRLCVPQLILHGQMHIFA